MSALVQSKDSSRVNIDIELIGKIYLFSHHKIFISTRLPSNTAMNGGREGSYAPPVLSIINKEAAAVVSDDLPRVPSINLVQQRHPKPIYN